MAKAQLCTLKRVNGRIVKGEVGEVICDIDLPKDTNAAVIEKLIQRGELTCRKKPSGRPAKAASEEEAPKGE